MIIRYLIYFLLFQYTLCIEHFVKKPTNKAPNYQYKTAYFETKLDHFNFLNDNTFKIKYLYNTDNWQDKGSIFFYTGNEGPIEAFAENAGLMWDLAHQLKAVVLFCEHRYYGDSKPFGNSSFVSRQKFGYFTAEQALADFALFLTDFKEKNPAYKDAPVISFGGSYGGMLTSWFRQKYPNIVVGGLAASAPIFAFPGMNDCDGFSRVTTYAFKRMGGEVCVDAIKRSFRTLSYFDLDEISKIFNLCKPATNRNDLIAYIIDLMGNTAMVNYPYAASFLGKRPAWPVKYFCNSLKDFTPEASDEKVLQFLSNAVHSLIDYGGPSKCLDFGSGSGDIDDNGWFLQTCMEMTMPMCSDSVHDMFPVQKFSLKEYSDQCYYTFHVRPRPNWAGVQWWGRQLPASLDNIIFSNGLLDPWSSLGVTDPKQAPGCTVIMLPNGAHHLDLRGSNPNDPKDIVRARMMYRTIFNEWINQWYAKRGL